MGKYFGTDGFRGEANVKLTADHAFRVGRYLGWYYGSRMRSFALLNCRSLQRSRGCGRSAVIRDWYMKDTKGILPSWRCAWSWFRMR